jgi:hypothetical protein
VRRSKIVFQLKMGDKLVNVSTERLKPVLSDDLVVPSLPPKRGRPKKTVTSVGNA